MTDLSQFPITRRWPAQNPDVIQLYSYPTPNGVKVSLMLEETGLPYEAHQVTLREEDVKSPEFTSLNPNGKIPAIIDPNGPDGPIGVFESGAILVYLSEKTGQFGGDTPAERSEILQWVMFQMGGLGPMFGQLGYFYAYAGTEIEDPRPQQRYINEARRILGVLDARLDGRDWVAGRGYSIADMAIAPWLLTLDAGYDALDAVGWQDLRNVPGYLDRAMARPAFDRAKNVPPRLT